MEEYPTLDTLNKIKTQSGMYPVESELKRRKEFSDREVGVTHPDLNSFIRLNDQGDIEIFASPGVGIVISTRSKSISLFADSIRFFTKDDGLRWNSYNFNYAASSYVEPTLVKINYKQIHSAQNGIYHYIDGISAFEQEELQKPITIEGKYGFSGTQQISEQKLSSDLDFSGLTLEQSALIEAYLSSYSRLQVIAIVKYIKEGLSFDQAVERFLRENNAGHIFYIYW
jgi:hypothetical protein